MFSLGQAISFAFSTYGSQLGKIARLAITAWVVEVGISLLLLFFIFSPEVVKSFLAAGGGPEALIGLVQQMQKTGIAEWQMVILLGFIVLLSIFIGFLLEYQVLRIGMAVYDQKEVKATGLFSADYNRFFEFVGARIWFFVKVALGFIALVIPAIYIFVAYYFSGFTIVDDKTLSIEEDTRAAREVSRTVMVPLGLSLILIQGLEIGFGLIPSLFGIGYFLMPLLALATAHMYKQLAPQE